MREASLVPTNLLDWPRVRNLPVDSKYIYQSLWSSPYLSCAGCGLLPVPAFAASLGVDLKIVESGLDVLCKSGLVGWDKDTGEIFILDWFRFHKFKTSNQQNMLKMAIRKIQSDSLKSLVHEKSRTYLPTTTSTSTSTSTKALPRKPVDNLSWCLSAKAIQAKGVELGIVQGDTHFQEFKMRVFEAAGLSEMD